MSEVYDHKDLFLKVIVHKNDTVPDMYGLCVPFECEQWMVDQFVNHLFEYLPEFALKYDEFQNMNGANAVKKIKKLAKTIYQSDKFKNRGEFGELILHSIIREMHHTIPAISKIYYKDSANDTVKGFDAVHVVNTEVGLELWLGEAKFYSNARNAVRDVVEELKMHVDAKFLHNEFLFLQNKIDSNWPHADKLKKLMDGDTSLDDVFPIVRIPVLLTYNSEELAKHTAITEDLTKDITEEFDKIYQYFIDKLNNIKLEIHLYLLPLNTKDKLIEKLDKSLKTWQQI